MPIYRQHMNPTKSGSCLRRTRTPYICSALWTELIL
jgi:hypothetical protein